MFSRNVFRILFPDLKKKNCSQKQMYSLCFSDLFSVFLRRVTGVLLAETRVLSVFCLQKHVFFLVFLQKKTVFYAFFIFILVFHKKIIFKNVFLAEKDGVLCVFHIYPCL